MSRLPDPIQAGLQRGWQVLGPGHAQVPQEIACDVAVVGSGAGGAVSADLLSAAGLNVVLVEEGPLVSSSHFRQLESEAYAALYQESAARKTADKAITVLQGRCVGGSTTVNWTSSFRTPPATLAHWRSHHGLPGLEAEAMAPWFEQVERRLHISRWSAPPNENNELLRRGAAKLGIATGIIHRNVRGCWNLGSCGMGCPTNAKQSMLVTTVPAALERGARLLVSHRVQRLQWRGDQVVALHAQPVLRNGAHAPGPAVRIRARHYVLAGGAINSPALLLRSQTPDPHGRLGLRTFLHPVVIAAGLYAQRVEGWNGAPQTEYSDHFLDTQPPTGPIGFKLEAPPLHPLIFSTTMPGFGPEQGELMKRFAHFGALLALLRDGFHEESPGGRVTVGRHGQPVLDYPLTDYVMHGARRALLAMAELQFASGAQQVMVAHELARPYARWDEAREAIAALPMKPLLTRVVSAHVMGGCAMAPEAAGGVVRPDGVHWQLQNLSVHDGSLFPTSIGANPQLSVYGLANKLATGLARRLGGAEVRFG